MSVFGIHSRILIYLLSLGQTTVGNCFTILMDPVLQYAGHRGPTPFASRVDLSGRVVTATGILRPFYITYKAPGATSSTPWNTRQNALKGKGSRRARSGGRG